MKLLFNKLTQLWFVIRYKDTTICAFENPHNKKPNLHYYSSDLISHERGLFKSALMFAEFNDKHLKDKLWDVIYTEERKNLVEGKQNDNVNFTFFDMSEQMEKAPAVAHETHNKALPKASKNQQI